MKRISVVSDLHIFCSRSNWEKKLSAIEEAIQSSDIFVFNGDTFDFRWANEEKANDVFQQAVQFLRSIVLKNPKCQIHLNLGNHDHHRQFCQLLTQLENELPNFSWHPYYLRIGNIVFLHGDASIRKMRHSQLQKYRARWEHKPTRNDAFLNQIYDVAVQMKTHVVVSRLYFRRRRTARNLLWYLEDLALGKNSGITEVYFGHTHVPLRNFRYKGITFHNSGTAYKGMKLNILRTLVL
ncbi:MAG TPA: metallophosphoesterase [Candidatus Hydrogenedens sp.]|nr:metallophosphoesterase [Candidatus Hydrogenedens sp.]HOK09389.1 metallophosphoesterase [Candidatus Hydrogenedens sp.]HOL19102.1 metallophosphoesterase [Candidatus Hydrogenedens sp.]HPP58080.1 metallophosphoesterase [Candidatus Hydrogenedens sp.]